MEENQKSRIKWLIQDYLNSGVFGPNQISAGAYGLARRLCNPHIITLEELNGLLREERLPEITQATWDKHRVVWVMFTLAAFL